jgi:hypothetical protein
VHPVLLKPLKAFVSFTRPSLLIPHLTRMFSARVYYYAGRHVHKNPEKLKVKVNAAIKFMERCIRDVDDALRNLQGAQPASQGAPVRLLHRAVPHPPSQAHRPFTDFLPKLAMNC